MKEDAPQREHDLRAVFNGLRWIIRTGAQWRMMPNDLPPWRTVYQQAQRWIKELSEAVQEATQQSVEVAFVDQGYTGDHPKNDAK
jgi:transposase